MVPEVKKLNFALSQSLDSVIIDIIKTLPNVKLDWSYHKSDQSFETSRERISIKVKEKSIEFKVLRRESEEVRVFKKTRKVGKTTVDEPINLYAQLLERFMQYDDFSFYKKILGNLNGQIEKQKRTGILTFTEDGTAKYKDEIEDS